MASVIVAIKYNEDDYYSNVFYAKVGGLSLEEVNFLEYEFLKLIDFEVFVDCKVYSLYSKNMNWLYVVVLSINGILIKSVY